MVVLCHKSHFFADRNWLYTAVTRAKKKLTIVATEESITEAIKREVARSSGLAARLENPSS